jgi:peptide deformylase
MKILNFEEAEKILRKPSKTVKKIDENIKSLGLKMLEIMREAKGIGLAAPQLGILKRVIVVEKIEEKGPYILINPRITKREGEEISTEGCLCFPEMIADIKRAFRVKVKGIDENGKKVEIEAEGLLARVFQHEIDHLNGILIIDRAEPQTFRKREEEKEI